MTISSSAMDAPSKAGAHGLTPVGTPNGLSRLATKDKLTLRDHIAREMLQQQRDGGSTIKLIGMGISFMPEADVNLLENVERLSLRKNLLTNLPANFDTLRGLRYLDLDGNMLREIPAILMQCPKLEILDLSYNKIESLPQDISSLWSENLKVLSLKNNNVTSIWDMSPVVRLENLSVLEIEGNPLPKEELDMVQFYTPITSGMAKEEYWATAIRRYLLNHFPPSSTDLKMSRVAKRMGFISTSSSFDHSLSVSPSPVSQFFPLDGDSSISHNDTSTTSNNELYNHSKFNDYFKRLSILPEESQNNSSASTNSGNEQHKVPHDELVIACRKLLFSFTECQQNIRKIASFCKEKSVAVSVVSLLYSVRSHIDNLVELLEQAETKESAHDGALIKLCITIVNIFKQIISRLRKNFKAFFEADDLCFIRMFYMTLICSYNEIYNAWCFIDAEDAKSSRKRSIDRSLSSSMAHPLPSTNGSGPSGIFLPRTRSNTLQSKVGPVSLSNGGSSTATLDSAHPINKVTSPTPGTATPPYASNLQANGHQITPPPAPASTQSAIQLDSRHQDHSPRQYIPHSPKPKPSESNHIVTNEPELESPSGFTSTTNINVDQQLYQTLRVVIKMVSVVYDQLTSMISKTAHASSAGQQELTDYLLAKIRDLTDTCCQSMDLSKILSERLNLLTSVTVTSEKYLTNNEKLKTWENINAFLKSIISILANTKVLMEGLPALNEIRPNLASLAKVTKDVTVVLDLSSYKGVSTLAAQIQSQPQSQPPQHPYPHQHQYPHNQTPSSHQHQQQQHQNHHQNPYQYQPQHQHDDHVNAPMITPQPTPLPNRNPFEEV